MASITLIRGCMFSGKTTALIRAMDRARRAGRKVVVVKHSVDDRSDGETVSTHTDESVPARPVANSREILEQTQGADWVAIDEAHFFDEDLADVCAELRARGVDVVVTTLDRTWKGEEFEVVRRLAALADAQEQLLAVCVRCGRPATLSQRIAPFETPGDFVGGAESYEPRCAECFVPGVDATGGGLSETERGFS